MCKIIYNLIKIRQPEKRSRNEFLAFLVHLIQRVVDLFILENLQL